jgi:putative CocE/NonD family hydrolase
MAIVKYYFHSCGHANTCSGDGILNTEVPDNEQSDRFLYDPRNPVPSDERGMGAFDQQQVEDRPDILVCTSEVVESDLEVNGHLKIILYASSSAIDTDFFSKLVDVWPNGKAYNISLGIK